MSTTTQQQNEAGFERVFNALFRLETVTNYVGPLLEAWKNVLVEDNRRGVMQGIDGDGKRMKPTKYRKSLRQTDDGQAGDAFFNAQGEEFSNMEGEREFFFSNQTGGPGVGFKPGPSANLKNREYRKMTGPPLAPRGPASRVISNYTVEPLTSNNGNTVGVEGGWDDVVSDKGFEFLPVHFQGFGSQNPVFASSISGPNRNMPRRNLVGLRAWGKKQARLELNAWVKWLMTVAQPEYFRKTGANPKYVTMRKGSD
jgi:hypothetical protein